MDSNRPSCQRPPGARDSIDPAQRDRPDCGCDPEQPRAGLEAARSAAEHAGERDELLAWVAHELRGPLNTICGWVQLLQSGRLDAARQQHALEAIARGIQAQATLIDEMQRVFGALRNRLQMTRTLIDPASPLQRAIESCQTRAAEKSIVISATIDHGARMSGDGDLLTQLFTRLLDNAVRSTPEHGSVAVRLCARENEVWVIVADAGIGIPPDADALQQILETFATTTDDRLHNHRGLGAGVALVRRIAELHDGRIHAYSDGPGRGARFVVALPVARAHGTPASADCSSRCASTGMSPLHIVGARRHERGG